MSHVGLSLVRFVHLNAARNMTAPKELRRSGKIFRKSRQFSRVVKGPGAPMLNIAGKCFEKSRKQQTSKQDNKPRLFNVACLNIS